MTKSIDISIDPSESATPNKFTFIHAFLAIISFLFVCVLATAVVFGVLYFMKPVEEVKVYPWVRLPTNLEPSHYNLFLSLYTDDDPFFNGSVTITFKCVSPTQYIVLHSHDLTLYSVSLDPSYLTKTAPTIAGYETDSDKEFLIVELTSFLVMNSEYELTITFMNSIETTPLGFYKAYFSVLDENSHYVYTPFYSTQFQATGARRVFPCFDEPSYKAVFLITMEHPDDVNSLANSDLDYSISLSDEGRTEDHFLESFIMSTYLVSFYVSETVNQSTEVEGTLIRVWAQETEINETDYELAAAALALQFYFDIFGDMDIDYNLTKADNVIVTENTFSGMENWGIITYNMDLILYDPKTDTAERLYHIQELICHEYAHYWTGNLVTASWWDELWMNEGFGSFLQFLCQDGLFNDTDYAVMMGDLVDSAMLTDSYVTADPLSGDNIVTTDEIMGEFSLITYYKGSGLNWMFYDFLGPDIYMTGLKNMLIDNVYGIVSTEDIIDHWYIAAAEVDFKYLDNIKDMGYTWTKQMGFPLLSVNRSSNILTITQSHFLMNPEWDEDMWYFSKYHYTWVVPVWVCYETIGCDDPEFFMLTEKTTVIEVTGLVDGDWLMLNPLHGFYRVNYDLNGWDLLQAALTDDINVFNASTRIHLISDILNNARIGAVTVERALNFTTIMKNETSYIIWKNYMEDIIYFLTVLTNDSDALETMKKYLRESMYDELFTNFTSDSITDYDESTVQNCIEILACAVDTQACVNISIEKYNEWMINDTFDAYFSMESCTALRNAGDDYEEMAETAFQKISEMSSAIASLVPALACVNTVDMTSSMKLFISESNSWYSSLLSGQAVKTRTTLDVLWYIYGISWSTNLYEKDNVNTIGTVATWFNNEDDISTFEEFVTEHSEDVDGVPRLLDGIREKIATNIYFLENYLDDIKNLEYNP